MFTRRIYLFRHYLDTIYRDLTPLLRSILHTNISILPISATHWRFYYITYWTTRLTTLRHPIRHCCQTCSPFYHHFRNISI